MKSGDPFPKPVTFVVATVDDDGRPKKTAVTGWYKLHKSGALAVLPREGNGVVVYGPGRWQHIMRADQEAGESWPDPFDHWLQSVVTDDPQIVDLPELDVSLEELESDV